MKASLLALLCVAVLPARADDGAALLDDVNQTVSWYRRIAGHAALATEPSDILFQGDDLQLAREALSLELDFARADAALLSAQQGGGSGTGAGQNLARAAQAAADKLQKGEAEVAALERAAAAARTERAKKLAEEQLAAAKSDLALLESRASTLKSLSEFIAQAGGSGGGLAGQIDELERSVPEARAGHAQPAPPATAPAARRAQPGGVVELFADLFSLSRKLRELRDADDETARLHERNDKLRAPLLAQMKAQLAAADAIAASPEPTAAAALLDRKKKLDDANASFRKLSAALVPLAKEGVLLDSVRANLGEWHAAAQRESDLELRNLMLRLGLVVFALCVVLAGAELWRRATFRYVKDLRRRQQSLLVRRIVVTVVVSITLVFSLVSELGSLATFAGFITAGLAVALQNVILSVAAYFFLIGKQGVRVGDRVQVGGVTGDVLDLGLVRMHLMEVREGGLPTGRVVVFSNAQVFGSSSFFKQLPGSEFSWHELKITLPSGSDYKLAEQQIMAKVDEVFQTYREQIDRQHAAMTRNVSIELQEARPQSRLRLTDGGVEMVVRFPVPLARASAVDDQMTRAILAAMEADPRLQASGKPTIAPEPAP